jgi:hypothetical protein
VVMARPPKFTPTLAAEICRQVADGDALSAVCKRLSITREAVRQWREKDQEFAAAFSIAREQAADAIADEARELLEKAKPKDMVEIALLRERVQHLRWTAKALNPRRYGDRTQVEGAIGSLSFATLLDQVAREHTPEIEVLNGHAEDVRLVEAS